MSRRAFAWSAAAAGIGLSVRPALAAAPTAAADVWPYLAKLSGDQRQATLEREANREGSLTIYGATGIDRAQFLIKDFNNRYPNIECSFVRLTQDDVVTRTVAEQRTGKTASDLVISTVTYAELVKDTFAPYQHRSWADWDKRFLFGSYEEGWTSVVLELLPTTIAWRTDRGISDADAPKNLADVQDPKWKGRTACTSQLEEFIDAMTKKYGEEDGMRQVANLAALNNQIVASNASLAETLGSGQVDMTWNFVAHRAYFLQRRGAPIKWAFMEPQFAQGVGLSVSKAAPKPYAAALFMDHLLEADTLERLDKLEPGRIFGNLKGKYDLSLESFPDLTIYQPIPAARFKKLNRYVEENFKRRKSG
jgi:iron(III) transport system substrate-binding protein